MYEASDLFKKAISDTHRELRIRATIEGTVYSGSDVQQCNVEESILTGEHFKLGSATASTFDLTLLNMDDSLTAKSFEGKEVHIEIGAVLDKFDRPIEYASLGYFLVEEASKEKNLIKMSGYDRMIHFEKPYVSSLTYPATLLQITQEICSLAGVELENTDFLNNDYTIVDRPEFEELKLTLRKSLEYVSELAAGFACINRSGKLGIVSFENTDITIDRSNYYSMKLSEYEYTVDKVVINNEGITEEMGTGPNILEIKDNIFSFNDNTQLLTNIYDRMNDFNFKPFNCLWQGNVLTAPSDIIQVSYKDGETYQSFISKQKFSYSDGLKCNVETNAKTKLQIDFETRGSVTNELNKTKATIKNLGDEIRLEVERIDGDLSSTKSELSLVDDEIKLSVSDLDTRLGDAEASITLNADNIELKVSETDYNGETIVGKINLSASTAKIEYPHVDIYGQVTFSDLTLSTQDTINGKADSASLGDLAWDDVVEKAKLGSTLISGGLIRADVISTEIQQVNAKLHIGGYYSTGSEHKGIYFESDARLYTLATSPSTLNISAQQIVMDYYSYIGSVASSNRIATIGDITTTTIPSYTGYAGYHSHGGSTGSVGDHNHGITPGRYIRTYDSSGNSLGLQMWQASGGHSHSISAESSHRHSI